jgi:hypothetical protein
MLRRKIFIAPLIAWCLVVTATLWAFLFLEPSGDGSTRGFTFIWIGLFGFVSALALAFTAARMARGADGPAGRLARSLPMLMAFIVLVPLVLRMVLVEFDIF